MNRAQLIGYVVVSAILLATSGSRKASAPASVAPVVSESDTGVIDEPATLRDLRQQANELFRAGQCTCAPHRFIGMDLSRLSKWAPRGQPSGF